jgi:protoporphyrinogen oxidase
LSPTIAGRRLKGLGLWTVLCETFLGKKAKTRHLEGMGFYYPRGGFGMIPEQFAASCGMEHIVVDAAVTRILHDEHRVVSIEINGVKKVAVGNGHVVSTMPINAFIQGLEPKAPDHILKIAQALRFQHMVLAVLFVDRASFTKNATVYLPDPDMPFTRIYEPKNRSSAMAPKDKTCLVFEVPCQKTHAYWTMGEEEILEQVRSVVVQKGWLQDHEIINGLVHRFEYAYPILEKGYEQKVDALLAYLGLFKNLHLSGRNGLFAYSWLHDIILSGKEIVGTIAAAEGPGAHE